MIIKMKNVIKIFQIFIVISILSMVLVLIFNGHQFPNIVFLKVAFEIIFAMGIAFIPIISTILFIIIMCSGLWNPDNIELYKKHKVILCYFLYFLVVCSYYGYNIFFVKDSL